MERYEFYDIRAYSDEVKPGSEILGKAKDKYKLHRHSAVKQA